MTAPAKEDLFLDWEKLTSIEDLRLPIRGKVYRVPPIGIKTGMKLMLASEGDENAVKEFEVAENWHRAILGTAYDEMLEDDVPVPAIERAAITALADFRYGRVTAMETWRLGRDPEAMAAFMAATLEILKDTTGEEENTTQ